MPGFPIGEEGIKKKGWRRSGEWLFKSESESESEDDSDDYRTPPCSPIQDIRDFPLQSPRSPKSARGSRRASDCPPPASILSFSADFLDFLNKLMCPKEERLSARQVLCLCLCLCVVCVWNSFMSPSIFGYLKFSFFLLGLKTPIFQRFRLESTRAKSHFSPFCTRECE